MCESAHCGLRQRGKLNRLLSGQALQGREGCSEYRQTKLGENNHTSEGHPAVPFKILFPSCSPG